MPAPLPDDCDYGGTLTRCHALRRPGRGFIHDKYIIILTTPFHRDIWEFTFITGSSRRVSGDPNITSESSHPESASSLTARPSHGNQGLQLGIDACIWTTFSVFRTAANHLTNSLSNITSEASTVIGGNKPLIVILLSARVIVSGPSLPT